MQYHEIGKYLCALGHQWEGSLTTQTACPRCQCASQLQQVITVPDYQETDTESAYGRTVRMSRSIRVF